MRKVIKPMGVVLGCLLIILSVHTSAAEEFIKNTSLESKTWLEDINWHGFISQNFVATDENNFLGSSSDGSFKSNEAAINASWRPYESLQLSMQGIYKQIGNAEPKGGRVDYAIIDWRFLDQFNHGAGVRVGRLKNPWGFFNETRDVAATNLSILLPESIYLDYLSQFFHSSDSLALYSHHEMSKGTLVFTAQYGQPILEKQLTKTLITDPNTSGEISDERGGFLRIGYEDGSGIWRSSISYVRFRGDFTRSASDPSYLNSGSLNIEQLMLSLELNCGDWQFISEVQRRNIKVQDVFSFDTAILNKSLSYYFQAGYSFTPAWKMYLRRDETFRNKDDRHGHDYIAFLKTINPMTQTQAHSTFAKDTTLGFRYSPSFEWSFAMEVHQIDGTNWLPNIENPDLASHKRYWNMFLAQVAYRF